MKKQETVVFKVLKAFVKDANEKMITENPEVIGFIENQIAQYGVEKHTAFLKRVFHEKQVDGTSFFKTLKNVAKAIENKGKTATVKEGKKSKEVKTTVAKTETPKPEVKKDKKSKEVKKDPTTAEIIATKMGKSDIEILEETLKGLVDQYKTKHPNAKISLSMTYSFEKTTQLS